MNIGIKLRHDYVVRVIDGRADYPFKKLLVGESFSVSGADLVKKTKRALERFEEANYPRKFIWEKQADKSYRFWRKY